MTDFDCLNFLNAVTPVRKPPNAKKPSTAKKPDRTKLNQLWWNNLFRINVSHSVLNGRKIRGLIIRYTLWILSKIRPISLIPRSFKQKNVVKNNNLNHGWIHVTPLKGFHETFTQGPNFSPRFARRRHRKSEFPVVSMVSSSSVTFRGHF